MRVPMLAEHLEADGATRSNHMLLIVRADDLVTLLTCKAARLLLALDDGRPMNEHLGAQPRDSLAPRVWCGAWHQHREPHSKLTRCPCQRMASRAYRRRH